jgi:NADH-quinone oxidoreductase subunit L
VFAKSNELREIHHIDHSTEWMLMAVSVGGALLAAIIAWSRYSRKPEIEEPRGFGRILHNKWYVDELYDKVIVRPVFAIGRFFSVQIEKNIIDWIVNGSGRLVQYGGRQMRWIQSGQVGSYVLLMVLGMLVFFVVQFFIKK